MKLLTTLLTMILVISCPAAFVLLLAFEQVTALGETGWNIVAMFAGVAVLAVAALVGLLALARRRTITSQEAADYWWKYDRWPNDGGMPGENIRRHPGRRGAARWFWSEGEYWETRTDRDGEERLVRRKRRGR